MVSGEVSLGWIKEAISSGDFNQQVGSWAVGAGGFSPTGTSIDLSTRSGDFAYSMPRDLYGSWSGVVSWSASNAYLAHIFFAVDNWNTSSYRSGYGLKFTEPFGGNGDDVDVEFVRVNADGSHTVLASGTITRPDPAFKVFRWFVSRTDADAWKVRVWDTNDFSGSPTVLTLTATDSTFTTFQICGLQANNIAVDFTQLEHTQVCIRDDTTHQIEVVVDRTATPVIEEGIFEATTSGSWTFAVDKSTDDVTYDGYESVTPGGTIPGDLDRYARWKATPSFTWYLPNYTTKLFDVVTNWFTGGGSPKYPTALSNTYRYDGAILDIEQSRSDQLGGDTSVLNNVTVEARPVIKQGTDSDNVFQGTAQTPPVAISGSAPLAVTNGQVIEIEPIVSPMNTSLMSGASPAAAVVTGASCTWTFTRIHPTRPKLRIVAGATSNITDLRIVGKTFSDSQYVKSQTVKDATSIALYGDRQFNVTNPYIVSEAMALNVATKLVENYKDPTDFIPNLQLRPSWSVQVNDRVKVIDKNLDLSTDYLVVALEHFRAHNRAGTKLTVVEIPS